MPTTPPAITRSLRIVGRNLATQRKLLGLTAKMVAERAGTTQQTISKLENGQGTSLEITLRILRVLGLMDGVVSATDPFGTERGRLMVDEKLPERVRVRKRG
ncbi:MULTISPECIES: helix-turn-helix domain-containing protein [Clavibacter]|uniref:XRE family transcriptional regulator n=1 Tax=Clavibacter tessellarius TaxID=31965 RepID=A0A154UZY0_9MICO|nr:MULTISPECIES: helix-turn-helix transcriptional regulator [Clavibacter]KZC94559.1 XRE family transcriptional regulator [Clavibacter michiganensis subsp. tessellarius]MDA3804859.1 helix-turn-helix transcriptional regulator [Clavibacter sp. CT19]